MPSFGTEFNNSHLNPLGGTEKTPEEPSPVQNQRGKTGIGKPGLIFWLKIKIPVKKNKEGEGKRKEGRKITPSSPEVARGPRGVPGSAHFQACS